MNIFGFVTRVDNLSVSFEECHDFIAWNELFDVSFNAWESMMFFDHNDTRWSYIFFFDTILFRHITWTLSARAFNVNLRLKLRFYYKTISGISVLWIEFSVTLYSNNNINISVIFPTTALFQTKWAYLIYNKWTRTYLRDNEWFAWFESRTVCIFCLFSSHYTLCAYCRLKFERGNF